MSFNHRTHRPDILRGTTAILALIIGSGCTPARADYEQLQPFPTADQERVEITPARPAPPPPHTPALAPPGTEGDSTAWNEALSLTAERIVISREQRRLWLMRGDSAVFAAPVAVGRDTIFRYRGKAYDFSTPTGRREVLDKEESPDWVPPNWHYYEIAAERDLEPVHLGRNERILLSDSTWIEVRDGEVGRVNRFGNWHPFTPGTEIIFDDKIFVPPIPSPQRQIPRVLGTHRLILGDGYLIHGTPEEDSIGEEASHGCVRMFNRDVEELYQVVDTGTPVYIY